MVAEAKRAGDVAAEVDGAASCLLLQSDKLTRAQLDFLKSRCAHLEWTATPLAACSLPLVVWQFVDGFASHANSVRLLATCRFMAALALGAYPRSHVAARDPDALVRDMRAAPRRYLAIGTLAFLSRERSQGWSFDRLTGHIADALGSKWLSVRTLRMSACISSWLAAIRVCPHVRTIALLDSECYFDAANASLVLEAATRCTSFESEMRFRDFAGREQADLVIPAHTTRVALDHSAFGLLVFRDPARVTSLALPRHSEFAGTLPLALFTSLERLHYPQEADFSSSDDRTLALFASPERRHYPQEADLSSSDDQALPRLIELALCKVEPRACSLLSGRLEVLHLEECVIGYELLAHLLRPESRLVTLRCRSCEYAADELALERAFEAIALAGSVTHTLRELMLPPMLPPVQLAASAGDTTAAFLSTKSSAFLGRDSHAAFDPCFPRCRMQPERVSTPRGLALLLTSNRCAVGLGSHLVFQPACSRNCIHMLASGDP